MYEIKTEDVYEYSSKNKEMFDFSNCPSKSQNIMMVETMKHETAGCHYERIFWIEAKDVFILGR